jgi:hypothetical protein
MVAEPVLSDLLAHDGTGDDAHRIDWRHFLAADIGCSREAHDEDERGHSGLRLRRLPSLDGGVHVYAHLGQQGVHLIVGQGAGLVLLRQLDTHLGEAQKRG